MHFTGEVKGKMDNFRESLDKTKAFKKKRICFEIQIQDGVIHNWGNIL